MIKPISPEEVKQGLESGTITLVDVRENDEWAAGHIANATHIPLATVTLNKIPNFTGKKLVMQCKSGGRSRTACGKLLQENPDLEIYNLEGGITAWMAAGFDMAR